MFATVSLMLYIPCQLLKAHRYATATLYEDENIHILKNVSNLSLFLLLFEAIHLSEKWSVIIDSFYQVIIYYSEISPDF